MVSLSKLHSLKKQAPLLLQIHLYKARHLEGHSYYQHMNNTKCCKEHKD